MNPPADTQQPRSVLLVIGAVPGDDRYEEDIQRIKHRLQSHGIVHKSVGSSSAGCDVWAVSAAVRELSNEDARMTSIILGDALVQRGRHWMRLAGADGPDILTDEILYRINTGLGKERDTDVCIVAPFSAAASDGRHWLASGSGILSLSPDGVDTFLEYAHYLSQQAGKSDWSIQGLRTAAEGLANAAAVQPVVLVSNGSFAETQLSPGSLLRDRDGDTMGFERQGHQPQTSIAQWGSSLDPPHRDLSTALHSMEQFDGPHLASPAQCQSPDSAPCPNSGKCRDSHAVLLVVGIIPGEAAYASHIQRVKDTLSSAGIVHRIVGSVQTGCHPQSVEQAARELARASSGNLTAIIYGHGTVVKGWHKISLYSRYFETTTEILLDRLTQGANDGRLIDTFLFTCLGAAAVPWKDKLPRGSMVASLADYGKDAYSGHLAHLFKHASESGSDMSANSLIDTAIKHCASELINPVLGKSAHGPSVRLRELVTPEAFSQMNPEERAYVQARSRQAIAALGPGFSGTNFVAPVNVHHRLLLTAAKARYDYRNSAQPVQPQGTEADTAMTEESSIGHSQT